MARKSIASPPRTGQLPLQISGFKNLHNSQGPTRLQVFADTTRNRSFLLDRHSRARRPNCHAEKQRKEIAWQSRLSHGIVCHTRSPLFSPRNAEKQTKQNSTANSSALYYYVLHSLFIGFAGKCRETKK